MNLSIQGVDLIVTILVIIIILEKKVMDGR